MLALVPQENIRQKPSTTSGNVVEREPGIVRVVSSSDGWHGISWCDLDGLDADAVIAAQIQRFSRIGQPWEWKHYSHDRPADLPGRLLAAGFEPDPVEGLLFAELADLPLDLTLPAGTRLEAVTDAAGVDLVVAVHDKVFGGDHSRIGKDLTARLADRPDSSRPPSSWPATADLRRPRRVPRWHRLRQPLGRRHVADWRGRGVFRALVAHRAALAARRLPLPPGRRLGGQPADPAPASGFSSSPPRRRSSAVPDRGRHPEVSPGMQLACGRPPATAVMATDPSGDQRADPSGDRRARRQAGIEEDGNGGAGPDGAHRGEELVLRDRRRRRRAVRASCIALASWARRSTSLRSAPVMPVRRRPGSAGSRSSANSRNRPTSCAAIRPPHHLGEDLAPGRPRPGAGIASLTSKRPERISECVDPVREVGRRHHDHVRVGLDQVVHLLLEDAGDRVDRLAGGVPPPPV